MDQFQVVESCAGIEFSFRAGCLVTLGTCNSETEISAETAKDLLKAGFIRKAEVIEKAVEAPIETATRKMEVKLTRKVPSASEQTTKQAE